MSIPAILAELEAFRLRHAREVDAWAEAKQLEIHAMSVARTRGMGQLFRHARVEVYAQFELPLETSDADFLSIVERQIQFLTGAMAPYYGGFQ